MKHKGKKKLLLLGSIIVTLVVAFIIVDSLYVNSSQTMADRVTLARNFEELDSKSDLIVIASVLPNKKNILLTEDDGTVSFGYTLTQLSIDKIFSGETSEKTITITEEYYVTDDIIGKTIWTQGEYQPAQVKSSYIFFLKKYDESTDYKGLYFPIDLEYGKYLIRNDIKNSIDKFTNKELEVGDKADARYREWMKAVFKKYDVGSD